MASPRVLVLRAPGTNCDQETAFAFQQAGATSDVVHVNRILEQPGLPQDYQILCLPGGFSYGDDVAAGRILGNLIYHHLNETLAEFKAAGKLILGICNGFQVLIKSGVLLNASGEEPIATLTWNDSGKFEDRWVQLKADGQKCVFLRGVTRMDLPVAHAEGKFVTGSTQQLARLVDGGQVVLQYTDATGSIDVSYPANPNGSQAGAAGICDETGRVLGLMPHPERNIAPTHHPQWTRRGTDQPGDGLRMFQNAVEYFA
jgi:phosphoribosylformylglycinamidine synthase I